MVDAAAIRHPGTIAQVMVNFAARHGIDAATCLAGTGVSLEQLRRPGGLIERAQEMRLVENLIAALPEDAAPGFELGLEYGMAVFGSWGFALRASRNVRDAIRLAIRYLPLSTAYCGFVTFQDPQEWGVIADASAIPAHLRLFLLERDTATAINLLRQLGLSGARAQRIEFCARVSPEHAARVQSLCGIAPVYGACRNAVVLRREDAETPLSTYDPHWLGVFEAHCRAELELRATGDLSHRVRQLVSAAAGDIPSLPEVARQLTLAPRSLRRKLRLEGTSYRRIVDDQRKRLATQLLESSDMKLAAVASRLGYDDTASFRRAFHRWFGQPPQAYRQSRQQDR